MDFEQLLLQRRSCRDYTAADLDADQVQRLLRAALLAPTSRNRRAWQFIVVDDKGDLEKLADLKEHGAAFLAKVPLAVVVAADPLHDDCYVEDCSIAAVTMQYAAEAMGLASCWVQVRGRRLSDGTASADVVRGILGIPDTVEVVCVVGFGHRAHPAVPHDDESLPWEQIHIDKY